MAKALQLELGEEPHKSQGLFSDHYLSVLRKSPQWQALTSAAEPARQAVRDTLAAYVPSPNEAQTEETLIKPVLRALGHTFEVQAPLKTPEGTKKPDYVYYNSVEELNANKGQVLTDALPKQGAYAVGDAKAWDRNLDQASKASGADALSNKNPSYQIYFYMLHAGVEWGILTNGRLWRLYHRSSAHKLDVYYQVNLPALLALDDADEWLFFWAFFSRETFQDGPKSAASILQKSIEYAQGVSANLKSQVYQALRHIAQGFIDYPANNLQVETQTLKEIYDASLILLYRLLFVLYAEDRGLLPVWESEDYRESYSLRGIKQSVARALDGGRKLLPTSAKLWPSLRELFHIINAGSPPLKVTTFNGGLFDQAKHAFLERYTVGDAHLQQAIDMLARVNGQFVDYRDLSERHLGSIYEGLLEYHLVPIAPEEAKEQSWAGQWQVALENDRGERHATGSYYTPGWVVKYITDRALGPVLRERIEGLEDEAAIAEAVLSVNIVDPAMGSGHFLVEATEYIARFLVERGVRVPGGLASESEPDITAWKRRVVHSCIYGVDLNPLAVELAKLSLWLATVAKDRPLSFLDHHLRCGNSLVGSWISQLGPAAGAAPTKSRKPRGASKVSSAGENSGTVQLSMLDDEAFARALGTAVDTMWAIEETPGDTVAEVKRQEQMYARLRDELNRRYGRLADVMATQRLGALQVKLTATEWPYFVDFASGRSLPAMPQFESWLEQAEQIDAQHRFFHWELEFPEVWFNRNGSSRGDSAGFDAVIGNPPYIRQEQLTPYKPFLGAAYESVAAGTADIFVYFIGQGVVLLRRGGLLSYISSNSWIRANYATPLRRYLRTGGQVVVEEVVNLGDNRVFDDAPDVYPAILTLRRGQPPGEHNCYAAVFTRGEGVRSFDSQVRAKLAPVAVHDQDDLGWQLGSGETRKIFQKIVARGKPLGEVVSGRMYYGVKTGLNEAFLIDTATRDRLVAADPAADTLIKPMLRGEDLRPWYQENEGRWIIVLPAGWTSATFGDHTSEEEAWAAFATRHRALADYLLPFAEASRKRQDKGQYWWELRPCDYYGAFEEPKIMWPDIAKFPRFSCDTVGFYLGNTGYIMPTDQAWLLGFLGSRVAWFLISNIAVSLGERAGLNRYRLIDQYMRPLPIPSPTAAEQAALATIAMQLTQKARSRYDLHHRARRRILSDLGATAPGNFLNQKLTTWWQLDFAALRAELRKVFRRDISLKERDEWEEWFNDQLAEHQRLTTEIVRRETELNDLVYDLFDLTPRERQFIEESTKYAYGEV